MAAIRSFMYIEAHFADSSLRYNRDILVMILVYHFYICDK